MIKILNNHIKQEQKIYFYDYLLKMQSTYCAEIRLHVYKNTINLINNVGCHHFLLIEILKILLYNLLNNYLKGGERNQVIFLFA